MDFISTKKRGNAVKKSPNIILEILICALLFVNIVYTNSIIRKSQEDQSDLNLRIMSLESGIQGIRNVGQQVNTTSDNEGKEVMGTSELAEYLDIDMEKVYMMVKDSKSKIPYVSIDGSYRFNKDEIDKWLGSRTEVKTKQ